MFAPLSCKYETNHNDMTAGPNKIYLILCMLMLLPSILFYCVCLSSSRGDSKTLNIYIGNDVPKFPSFWDSALSLVDIYKPASPLSMLCPCTPSLGVPCSLVYSSYHGHYPSKVITTCIPSPALWLLLISLVRGQYWYSVMITPSGYMLHMLFGVSSLHEWSNLLGL